MTNPVRKCARPVVNVPLWTNINSGAMMGIKRFKYRKHTVLGLTLVKI